MVADQPVPQAVVAEPVPQDVMADEPIGHDDHQPQFDDHYVQHQEAPTPAPSHSYFHQQPQRVAPSQYAQLGQFRYKKSYVQYLETSQCIFAILIYKTAPFSLVTEFKQVNRFQMKIVLLSQCHFLRHFHFPLFLPQKSLFLRFSQFLPHRRQKRKGHQ